jgi:cell division protein FtsI/penicillin-binding protein 2
LVRKDILAVSIFVLAVVIASGFLIYWNDLDQQSKTKHETNRWAVITDSKGEIIAVETTSQAVWNDLKNLEEKQTQLWIGGNIEEYDNYWGFRFNPDTIITAEITSEGAQATIQTISDDPDYWINTWQNEVYVFAQVTEIH